MPDRPSPPPPPDQSQRERALDAARSILVRAPAGSGKTNLLTRRFLRLLAEVDDPRQIVAITFTKAAAAEMRHRILSSLESAAAVPPAAADAFSTEHLAHRALAHSQALGWNLLDLPAQLRISTIDSFCRELALQQPLLSGLGGGLDVTEQPVELYRRAACRTLEQIESGDASLRDAIRSLLLWRDNSWQDLETQLVNMLSKRDQWMHGFLLDPDWDALREQLERPFVRFVRHHLTALSELHGQVPHTCDEVLALARFACEQSGGTLHRDLAELAAFPSTPFHSAESLEDALQAYLCLAGFVLTNEGAFRKQINVGHGFPKERKAEKARMSSLIAELAAVPAFEPLLAAVRNLPPARYTDDEWQIIRACFILLRRAAAELRVVFAEAAAADFTEVAQIALNILRGDDNAPTDAALAVADGVRHLLVDEFQDTSRRQHQLLAHLIAAWPSREGRTCFVVGDPMQSIYFFRDADAELFPRVEQLGLEIPGDLPLQFDPVRLTANFRTRPLLVRHINDAFSQIVAVDDGSGVDFTIAEPAGEITVSPGPHLVADPAPRMDLHLDFMPETIRFNSRGATPERKAEVTAQRSAAQQKQIAEIVELIRAHLPRIEKARAANQKYRIAILGRARKSLQPIAAALRVAKIPFRALELEELKQRPEIIDALALARALLNPHDRVAWLGLLRAPWCGLSLADLHTLSSADSDDLIARPVPDLLSERKSLLTVEGQIAVDRVLLAIGFAERLRSSQPTATPGTWLEQVWLHLGGAQCVDATARANIDLLWATLDSLPQGETDLLGSALDAALDKLRSLPDPAAESDHGVQLMTIHGSKGLEFEVVVVPDLQAPAGRGSFSMLSWLERGLPPDADPSELDGSAEITEFLVAPFQQKGSGSGGAKQWVDRMRREREKQESRRLFYVACTRACNELHLFARPSYNSAADGSLTLCEPAESLLKTAWPAFESIIRDRFAEWRDHAAASAQSTTLDSLAASANVAPISIPPFAAPTLLRRLPSDFSTPHSASAGLTTPEPLIGAGQLYERHEGGLLSRALGQAVHSLLQQLAQSLLTRSWEESRAALSRLQPRIAAGIRAAGIDPTQATRLATQAIQIVLNASNDPIAQWILAPHPDAASEVRWTGLVDGGLRTVQVDRLFRAGPTPQSSAGSADHSVWWIIDYKSAHQDSFDDANALPQLRRIFAPQLQAYAKVLRNLQGASTAIIGALYYPRMTLFDWWTL